MCIQADTGKLVWENRVKGHFSASPLWAENHLYLLSEEGITTVIEAGPVFRILAQNELEGTCQASPAASQGNLLIRSDQHLFCIGHSAKD